MGRLATGLVIGLVAVVVAAAVVDSFRPSESKNPPAIARTSTLDPGVESRIAIASRLRQEEIAGRLVYTDERCELRAVRLPELDDAGPLRSRDVGCSFSLSPDGRRIASPGAAWSPDSRRLAICRGSEVFVTVGSERADSAVRHAGCVPAWRPDGVLTLVRDGELVEAGGRRVVPRAAIQSAARAHPFAPDPPQLRIDYDIADVAWLTARRVAVLLSIVFTSAGREFEPQTHLALFDGARVVGSESAVGLTWTRIDAANSAVALRPGWLVDGRARRLYPLVGTGLAGADAVAVSPDGLWVAIGLRGRVTLLSIRALRAGRFRSVSLPFAARDLAWR